VDIQLSNNSWPFVVDWNEDGRKDLLVGQEGIGSACNVFVYLNQGADSLPVFEDSTPVLSGGSPISSWRCAPVTEDLDRDGRKDLVLGEWYSSVRFYCNVGTNRQPVFSGFVNLVPPDPDSFLNGNPPRINFVDWDGDSDRDMVSCDYYGSVFLRRNVTPTGAGESGRPAVPGRVLQLVPSLVHVGRAVLRLSVPEGLRVGSRVELTVTDALGRVWEAGVRRGGLADRGMDVELVVCVPAGVYVVRLSGDPALSARLVVLARE